MSDISEYLADELRSQRNEALDDAAQARVDVRLVALTIGELETELYHAREDGRVIADELDAVYEWATGAGEYMRDLEKRANEAMYEALERLRERIDVLEAENERLSGLVGDEVTFPAARTDISVAPYYDEVLISDLPGVNNASATTTDDETTVILNG